MKIRNRRSSPNPQPPRGEFWLVLATAVLVATMALLHLAVQRERQAGAGALDFQMLTANALVTPPESAPAQAR